MKTKLLIILSLLLTVLSCTRHSEVSDTLARAEAMMEEHPDSALSILEAIPDSALASDRDRALHALLLTQALDKNYIDVTSDSLINIAVNHFQDHGSKEHLMKALFYKAVINLNQGNLASTVANAMDSYNIALDKENYYWTAKSSELLGDVAGKSKNNSEMAKYLKEAILYYKKAGKINNQRYALCDYARSLGNSGQFDSALHILDSIHSIALQLPIDTSLVAYSLHASLPILIYSGKFEKASYVKDKMIEFNNYYPLNALDIASSSLVDINNNREYDVERLLTQASSIAQSKTDSIAILYSYSIYYNEMGQYKKAKCYTDSILFLQNKIVDEALAQSVVSAQRDYFDKKAKDEHDKSSKLFNIILFIGISAFVLIVGILIIYHLNVKIKTMEIENKINDIFVINQELKDSQEYNSRMKETIQEKDNRIKNLILKLEENSEDKNKIENLFKEKWETLDLLCNEYYINGDSVKSRSLIVNKIENEINKIKDRKNIVKILESVDLYMDDIVTKLRTQCVNIKEDDIIFVSLIFAGFSPRAVSLLSGITHMYYYKKKHRLIERIKNSQAQDKSLFLSKLT